MGVRERSPPRSFLLLLTENKSAINRETLTVPNSIFSDKSIKPNDRSLAEVLGASYKFWEELKTHLEHEYGVLIEEWKFYSQKSGWTLKLLRKKRNLFFFTPCSNYFRLSFVFGDKAVAEIEKSDLPKTLINELVNAKRYPEGRGLRIEVKSRKDVEHIITLVNIKINN